MIDPDDRADVEELTQMLRHDPILGKLHQQLKAAGHDPANILMGGLIESEEEHVWAAFVELPALTSWYLEADSDDIITVLEERPHQDLATDFWAMDAAYAVAREKQ